MTSSLEDEIQRIVAGMDEHHDKQEQNAPEADEQQPQPEQTLHVHYFPDAIVILKEDEQQVEVIDSTPVTPQKISFLPVYAISVLSLLLIASTIAFQFYCIFNPPIATVTIIPKSQTVSLTGTLQAGRILTPLTISQSQTTPTTGKGHQDAKAASGYITLYNGQFQSVFIAAGTILTGASGVPIITEQSVTIPAGNPPSYGQISVPARAISPGAGGNIPAYDINAACCAASVLAKNTGAFSGGQDERSYSTVTQKDIHSISTLLRTTLAHSIGGALHGQVRPPEQVFILPCTPTVSSDHQVGDEATQVRVTVSQTCSAVAYNSQVLAVKASALLTTQEQQRSGAGYRLFGTVQVSVKQASVTNTSAPQIFISFQAQGTWVYALSQAAKQQITHLVAGKTIQQAATLVASLPGVAHASIRLCGFGDETRLPKQSSFIHISLFFMG